MTIYANYNIINGSLSVKKGGKVFLIIAGTQMITINIPSNNLPERKYIIDILFSEFLGLDHQIKFSDVGDYEIALDGGKKLVVRDHFFSKNNDGLSYLDGVNIPEKAPYLQNRFTVEENIPVLFGDGELAVTEKEITCGIDLFASAFFMLARWEEYANPRRDRHDRFSAYDSVAYRSGFLHRPVVNEWVEMIRNMLEYLGIDEGKKPALFQLIPTLDVDRIFYPFRLKGLAGDLIKRRSVAKAFKRIGISLSKENPYDTFGWLMDVSEQNGLTSRFYVMNGGTSPFDNNYRITDLLFGSIIEHVRSRGHIVGFHPSYNAYNDPEQWKEEKVGLEEAFGIEVREGREHFLRFEVPTTWRIWEENGMVRDSSMGYADHDGFRCGTGNEFSVFDVLERKKLGLKELPMVVMEGAPVLRRKVSIPDCGEIFRYYKDAARKYRMPFTIGFHNSSFDEINWPGMKEIYEDIFAD